MTAKTTATRREVKGPMRALECLCGQRLRATNDAKLSEQAHEHVDDYHPELRLGYERLGQFVARFAYDEQVASSPL
jgi:hypothetical protein